MDRIIESNGKTMLDNSLVIFGSECGIGYSDQEATHSVESLPTMVAGSANGRVNTGYYLDFRQRPFMTLANRGDMVPVGRPYTQLLCTMMRALGVPDSEFRQYGKNGYFGEFDPVRTYIAESAWGIWSGQQNDQLPVFSR
jgi:hypothetical protein